MQSETEGDIFDDYTTFFNPGTIDNNAGTIVDIYDLIMGSGNVTDTGTFVTISFTAKDASGTSSLDIYDKDSIQIMLRNRYYFRSTNV